MLGKILATAMMTACVCAGARTYVKTPGYEWRRDSVVQGTFTATAVSPVEIVSDYMAQPGYFMPVGQRWTARNDLSSLPRLQSCDRLMQAVFNMGLDEMVNAVEPDTTLRTGKEWAGVWTRDVSYSIILAMAALQPEAARHSLEVKINPDGEIIQDTGSGGAWPISSDRIIWIPAAYEVYLVTGDKAWLERLYDVGSRSLERDMRTIYSERGLPRGETSFIDWREQSYPRWMQPADISRSEAMGTAAVNYWAMQVLSRAAAELGHKEQSKLWADRAQTLAKAIDATFWNTSKGTYDMYTYGRNHLINNPRTETLGQSLAILTGLAGEEKARSITANSPVTQWGAPVFFPQIGDMPSYHNNALWPFVASYWTLANARAGNEQGVLQGMGSVMRPAALFATNKENLNVTNGDIATELNSSNMLWSLSGNLALTLKMLLGAEYTAKGLTFKPFVPRVLADTRTLSGLRYRAATVNVTVEGWGDRVAWSEVNGRKAAPFVPANAKGTYDIYIRLADNELPESTVNLADNYAAAWTPASRLVGDVFEWDPIEYAADYVVYRDGQPIDTVRTTSYDATIPGEYMVAARKRGQQYGFVSQPVDNVPSWTYAFDGRVRAMTSPEVTVQPAGPVNGVRDGYVELDRKSAPATVTIEVPQEGEYALTLRYANGNGPVNTDNRAAIRTLSVDGRDVAAVAMPQRGTGNWDDWGYTAPVVVTLGPGRHTVSLLYTPDNANMRRTHNHAILDLLKVKQLTY